MTSFWSHSGTGKLYPYFFCHNRDCEAYRKNVRAEKIDTAFEEVMRALTPSRQLLEIAIEMFKDALGQRAHQAVHAQTNLKRQIKALDKQQDALLARFVETINAKVGLALESKIAQIEDEKLVLSEKLEKAAQPHDAKPQDFELLRQFLSSPWKIYENWSLAMNKIVLKLALTAPLSYDRKTGFRTPQTSVIFEFLEKITSICEVAHLRGLKPRPFLILYQYVTQGFRAECFTSCFNSLTIRLGRFLN